MGLSGCGFHRYGHNELDDPTITLPLSYQAVAQHPPVLQQYTAKLHKLDVVASSEVCALQVVQLMHYLLMCMQEACQLHARCGHHMESSAVGSDQRQHALHST